MNMQEAQRLADLEKAEKARALAEQERAKQEAAEIESLRGEIVSLEWLLANPSFAPCKENADLVKKYFSQEGYTEWSSAAISKIFADHKAEFKVAEAPKPVKADISPRKWDGLTKSQIAKMDRETFRDEYKNDPEFRTCCDRVLAGKTPYREGR